MVELLSPAGSYEGLLGAFNAGADAVYFGMSVYSARAFAKNLDMEEALAAVRYARLIGKKTYLTLNTLMKEEELEGAFGMLKELYEGGLHGVIVQDFGLLSRIRKELPGIAIMASTQMAVTGVHGARLLKRMGVSRVVPARELSLEELRAIRHEADIEVEAFVHGAMCYSYSGMCLFSAMVGGRSGNRGRCAQACRMEYDGGDHILSMKDMCSVEYIPMLIRAGITSFKIEGRMKHPAYSAGVTAIYRKYIDRYHENPDGCGDRMEIDEEDMRTLLKLYIRTDISDGYLFRKNGREMITVSSPAYTKTDEGLIRDISDRFLTGKKRIRVDVECVLKEGERAEICMSPSQSVAVTAPPEGGAGGGVKAVRVYGEVVQKAAKRPLEEERVREIIRGLGETDLEAGNVRIVMDEGVFMPVGQLKALRNSAAEATEDEILSRQA